MAIFLAIQRGFGALVLLQVVEVFQEEPGALLRVIEFGGATGLFPKDVINVFEGLFKCIVGPRLSNSQREP